MGGSLAVAPLRRGQTRKGVHHGHGAGGDAARTLLSPGLRRRPRPGAGEQRRQQLPGLQDQSPDRRPVTSQTPRASAGLSFANGRQWAARMASTSWGRWPMA
jgi:hypothetical protein